MSTIKAISGLMITTILCATLAVPVTAGANAISTERSRQGVEQRSHQGLVNGKQSISELSPEMQLSVEQVKTRMQGIATDMGFGNDLSALSDAQKDAVLDYYFAHTPQPRSLVGTVFGVISGVIVVGRASYDVGYYAAKRCAEAGIVTRSTYKNYPYLYPAINATFGFLVALGFDDYMHNR